MYVPRQFQEQRPDILAGAIRSIQFATLVTPGADGLQVSHVPMVLKQAEDGAWTLVHRSRIADSNQAASRCGSRLMP